MKIDMRLEALLTAVMAGAIATAACSSPEASGTEAGTAGSGASAGGYVKVVNVEVRAVEPTDFTTYVRVTGAVEAFEDVVVSAQESGVIERLFADKGQRVSEGQAIARIDDEIVSAQVDEARASAALARERFERQRQLWEVEGIGSEIAFLQTKYDAESAQARLAFLEARLARHTIKSPIAGVLDERYADAGEMVSPGTPVARVLTVDRLKVVGGVPERFGPYVKPDGVAMLTFDVLPGREIEGRIDFVGAGVDPENRTFPVEIRIENLDGRLKPQMIANVRVATEILKDVIVVPRDVALRTENGYEVFVATGDGEDARAESRVVALGASFENQVVVETGLKPGDRLIVRGHQLVDSGDRVRVVGDGPVGDEP